MANRRMLAKSITNSSGFLMMPLSAQALYMHLNQNADDDGYCEYFGVMRLCGAQPDDLNVLKARQFVEIFDEKVLILRHWKENNFLRSDRYEPSKYLLVYQMDTSGIPNGVQVVDPGKDSVGKVSITTHTPPTSSSEVTEDEGKPMKKELPPLSPESKELWDYWEEQLAPITRNQIFSRNALLVLRKRHGSEAVKKMIRVAVMAHSEQYTPKNLKITSPKQLEVQWDALVLWAKGKFSQQQSGQFTV